MVATGQRCLVDDKYVRWMNVTCALVCGLSGSSAFGILNLPVIIHFLKIICMRACVKKKKEKKKKIPRNKSMGVEAIPN